MATQIKTRILNKYDLLANYSTFKPLKGEICIAEVTPTTPSFDGTKPAPIVGIKVGDGTHTFAELPWIQAVAGDVTAEIKALTGVADIDTKIAALEGRKLATVAELNKLSEELGAVKATVNHAEHGNAALKSAIDTLSSNTSNSLATKVDKAVAEEATSADKLVKKSTVTADIDAAKGVLNTAIQGVQTNVDNLANGAVKTNTEAISGINTKIGDEAIGDKSVTKAIADLQASIGNSSEGLGAQVEALKGRVDGHDTAIGTKAAQADLEALQGRVTTVENDLNTATTGLTAKVAAVEGKLEGIDTTVVAKISASEEATNAKIKAITDDYLKAADKQALQTQIDTIMSNPDAEGAINSINEFTQYVKDHGEIAEGFRTDINGLKAKVDTGDLTVSAYVAKALEDSDLDQYATVEALTGVTNRVTAIEGTADDASSANSIPGAKKYAEEKASAAQTAAEATAAADATAKANAAQAAAEATAAADATAKANAAQAAAEGKVTELANGAVKTNTEAITGINAAIDAMDYADPDATTVGGVVTKVTQDNGKIAVTHKKITMDEFDPDATFIFYCGTASDVI